MIHLNPQIQVSPFDLQEIARYTEALVRALRLQNKEISITFCNRPSIQKLNRRFRGKNKPTDVLSFPMNDKKILGDIFICPAIVREQAIRYGNSYLAELMYMIVHGLCHLAGHDHGTTREINAMHRAEQRLIAILHRNALSVKGRI